MQLTSFVVAAVLSLTLPLFTVAEHNAPSRRHTAIAQRKRGDVQTLQKRAFSGHATWYDVGLCVFFASVDFLGLTSVFLSIVARAVNTTVLPTL